MPTRPLAAHHRFVNVAFSTLARRRWAGVGFAILVEAVIVLPLAHADPSAVVGIPAAVAVAIAGTVAVVFGPVEGALVALVGAALFGWAGGWEAGELAALAVWPTIVVAAGLFARRVERHRRGMAELLTAQESERTRIALELHEERAQTLAAALLSLRQAERAVCADDAGAANQATRELIEATIKSLRELAVELRPKVLEDYGLAPAVEGLAASFEERTGIDVDVGIRTGAERLPPELELTLYRAVQEVLAGVAGRNGGGRIQVTIERGPGEVRALIERARAGTEPGRDEQSPELASLRERVRLAGGRLIAKSDGAGTVVRVELPLRPFASAGPRNG